MTLIKHFLINTIEGLSDLPTFFQKLFNQHLVSFMLCKNLKFFAASNEGKQITQIIDVGANTGQFAFMARYCWPNAHIDCFEPDPHAFKSLELTHQHDRLIHSFNYALGATSGELLLKVGTDSTQNSFLIEYGHDGESKREVPVLIKTLNDLYSEADLSNSLLKIDVQGYEMKVLEGASKILNKLDFILVEISLIDFFKEGAEFGEIWSFLKKRGFIYYSIIDQHRNKSSWQVCQMDILFKKTSV